MAAELNFFAYLFFWTLILIGVLNVALAVSIVGTVAQNNAKLDAKLKKSHK